MIRVYDAAQLRLDEARCAAFLLCRHGPLIAWSSMITFYLCYNEVLVKLAIVIRHAASCTEQFMQEGIRCADGELFISLYERG